MQLSDSLLVPQPDESLGQYIRRLRQQQGLSQKEVVGLAGIHLQSLGKIERGKTLKLNLEFRLTGKRKVAKDRLLLPEGRK